MGGLPVILMELNTSGTVMKSYIYENSRIIAQRNGGQTAAKYFYVNDRLGSVRQLIDMSGNVERNYTYSPFGQVLEQGGSFDNPFMFTGQWFDDEISQYYLRARMYDPALMRFTSRDAVRGKFKNPLALHVYLYCLERYLQDMPFMVRRSHMQRMGFLPTVLSGYISLKEWKGW